MSLNESIVEAAALEWFGELGYAVGHGPRLAPGEPAAERGSFGDVLLVGRLREAIRRLNPKIPEEAWEDALQKVLRVPATLGNRTMVCPLNAVSRSSLMRAQTPSPNNVLSGRTTAARG